ncbi:MAG: hypothetical protein AAF497_15565, partial [Planctomycetota bacterium]
MQSATAFITSLWLIYGRGSIFARLVLASLFLVLCCLPSVLALRWHFGRMYQQWRSILIFEITALSSFLSPIIWSYWFGWRLVDFSGSHAIDTGSPFGVAGNMDQVETNARSRRLWLLLTVVVVLLGLASVSAFGIEAIDIPVTLGVAFAFVIATLVYGLLNWAFL